MPASPVHLVAVLEFFDPHVCLVAFGFEFVKRVVQAILIAPVEGIDLPVPRAVAGEGVVGGVRLERGQDEHCDADQSQSRGR